MKRILLCGAVAAAAAALTSCSSDSENSTVTNLAIPSYNLYVNDSGSVFTGLASYGFTTRFPEQTLSISTEGMPLENGSSASFVTKEMTFGAGGATVDGRFCEALIFSDANASTSGASVTDLTGYVSQAAYPPPSVNVPVEPQTPGGVKPENFKRFVPGNSLHYVVMKYTLLDNYSVRTFWPDMTFRGNTVVTPSASSAFVTNTASFRVVMQMKNNAITDKADVIIYGLKTESEGDEISAMLLKDLNLAFTAAGYTVSGADVTLYEVVNDALVESAGGKVKSLEFKCTGDLTDGAVSCDLHGNLQLKFSGSSVATTKAQ